MDIISRQDKTRDLLDRFAKGNVLNKSMLLMNFFPSELDRFKGEFPTLKFEVTKTNRENCSKQYEVKITKK